MVELVLPNTNLTGPPHFFKRAADSYVFSFVCNDQAWYKFLSWTTLDGYLLSSRARTQRPRQGALDLQQQESNRIAPEAETEEEVL